MKAAARREQLLDVATDLAVEHGFHAVSVEAVARQAGCNACGHLPAFPRPAGAARGVIDRETSRALAQVSETTLADLSDGDPQELMLESLDAYLRAVHATRPPGASC